MGELIRTARQAKHLSQIDLANALGLRQQTVSKWEKGGALPSRAIMLQLAQVLAVPLEDLLEAAGWIDSNEDVRRRLRETAEAADVERAASGTNLDELRQVDPERYAELEELAAFYLERAQQRRETK